MPKKGKGEVSVGTLYFDDEEDAKREWRILADACKAAGNGASASLDKAGKGWKITVYTPKD